MMMTNYNHFVCLTVAILLSVAALADVCEDESQAILQTPSVVEASEAIFDATDPLLCEQGNRQATKIVCGTDYERDTPELLAAYQTACEQAGGVFQVAHTGVACTHETETEVDHDWVNIPHCVSASCPEDYAQANFTSAYFEGYRQSLEVNDYKCKQTSGAGASQQVLLVSFAVGVLALVGLC